MNAPSPWNTINLTARGFSFRLAVHSILFYNITNVTVETSSYIIMSYQISYWDCRWCDWLKSIGSIGWSIGVIWNKATFGNHFIWKIQIELQHTVPIFGKFGLLEDIHLNWFGTIQSVPNDFWLASNYFIKLRVLSLTHIPIVKFLHVSPKRSIEVSRDSIKLNHSFINLFE